MSQRGLTYREVGNTNRRKDLSTFVQKLAKWIQSSEWIYKNPGESKTLNECRRNQVNPELWMNVEELWPDR